MSLLIGTCLNCNHTIQAASSTAQYEGNRIVVVGGQVKCPDCEAIYTVEWLEVRPPQKEPRARNMTDQMVEWENLKKAQ